MNLSPIARGVNALCQELASAQPPAPASRLDVDYTQALIDQNSRPPKTIGWDLGKGDDTTVYWDMGVFDDCRRILDEQDRRASRRRLDGWWAKIGGNPPTFWPKTIEQKDLEEAFGHAQMMREGAVRTWFDAEDQRFRAEAVEMRTQTVASPAPPADLDLVKHYLRLAGIMRSMPAPQEPLRLTRREYIRFTTQMDVYMASGRRAGLNTLTGLSIEIIPGT